MKRWALTKRDRQVVGLAHQLAIRALTRLDLPENARTALGEVATMLFGCSPRMVRVTYGFASRTSAGSDHMQFTVAADLIEVSICGVERGDIGSDSYTHFLHQIVPRAIDARDEPADMDETELEGEYWIEELRERIVDDAALRDDFFVEV